MLSRLASRTDPDQALVYASAAAGMGDTSSIAVQAHLLDHAGANSPDKSVGEHRLLTISQLIAKLDPVYAFNAPRTEAVMRSGFANQLTGRI